MMKCGLWDAILMTIISAARIGMGLELGSMGPTILYLANNVNENVADLSQIFLARSIGIVLGAFAGGVIKRKASARFRHLFLLGASLMSMGVLVVTVPYLKVFWALVLNMAVTGIMYGYIDSGIQALILDLFGEKRSRSYVQLFHFGFSIGAFFGPMLAKPFLELYNLEKPLANLCPEKTDGQLNGTAPPQLTAKNLSIVSSPSTSNKMIKEDDPMVWLFSIIAVWMFVVGGALIMLGALNAEAKVSKSRLTDEQSCNKERKSTSENRKEEPILHVLPFFLFVMAFFCFAVSTENVFYFYLYPVTICSGLQLSVETASLLSSIMWLGLGIGRLTGTLIASFITPRNLLLLAIAGSIIDSLLMCIFGEQTLWLVWIVAFSHLFTTGMFYPAGVSWTASITNVCETYQFIFTLGASIGGVTMLPLAGRLFDQNPFAVMYLVLGLAVVSAAIFACGLLVARRHTRRLKKSTFKYSETKIQKGLL